MHEEKDGAFLQLMQDAATVGMSERDIVSCFSEWLLFDCWRFDGKDFHIFGNFRALNDVAVAVEDQGQFSFQGRFGDEGRDVALAKLVGALESRGSAVIHYPLEFEDGATRDFVSIGEYKALPDGSPGLIGIAFEAFKPLRQVSVPEGSGASAGD